MLNLDNPAQVRDALEEMARAGARAHGLASEARGLNGAFRDMLFGLNTTIDALVQMLDDG
jgi:hypothetical protein